MPRAQNNANPSSLTLNEYTSLIRAGLSKLRITPDHDLLETGYYEQALNDELTVNDVILELAADHIAEAPELPFGAYKTAVAADDPSGSRLNSWPVTVSIQDDMIGISLDSRGPKDQKHPAGAYLEHYDGELRVLVFHSGVSQPEITILKNKQQMSAEAEELLAAFNQVPRNPDNTEITEAFFIWPANTPAAEIEEWFEEPEA